MAVLPLAKPCQARTVQISNYSELVAACKEAEPHDVLVLAPGIYTVTGASRILIFNRPGPIVVKGATGRAADVIIQGGGQDDPTVPIIFDLEDSPQWTFDNLTTRNSYYHGFKFDGGSTDCVLRHVTMRDHGESGVKGTSTPGATTHPDRLLVEDCDIGFTSTRGGTRDVVEGIDGVGVKDWIIRHNRFVNVLRGDDGVATGVFTKGNSLDTIIESNRFENCFIGASFGGGGTGQPFFRDNDRTYEHRGGIIRNNVFVRCADAGIYINKGHECKIYNNTLFECGLTIQLRYLESSGWVCNNLVKPGTNNPNEPLVRARDGATLLAKDGNRSAQGAEFLHSTGDDSQIDVHLVEGSTAVDAGFDVGKDVPQDVDGEARPVGTQFDVGADEWMPTNKK